LPGHPCIPPRVQTFYSGAKKETTQKKRPKRNDSKETIPKKNEEQRTMMKAETDLSLQQVTLENRHLRVRFLPQVGSKIISMVYLPDNREFLFQPPDPSRPYRVPGYGALFKDFDNSGFDECLPTVGACRYPGESFQASLPDHGEVWSVPWECSASHDSAELRCRGRQLPFIFSKKLRLKQDSLLISYKVENTSAEAFHYLWSSHPLLAVRPGDRVMVPPEVREVFIDQSHSGRLGGFGDRTCWPLAVDRNGAATDLSLLHPPDAGVAEKYFTPRLSQGWCALHSPSTGHSITFRFDPAALPFVGMWINQGGWPRDSLPRHYTVALEQCSGAPDSLEKAVEFQQASALAGNQSKTWELEIQMHPGQPRL
jgi:galactose mutarotase-like enzyme